MATKIEGLDDLRNLRKKLQDEADRIKTRIIVCTSDACAGAQSVKVSAAFLDALRQHGLTKDVRVIQSGCISACSRGPLAVISPEDVLYGGLTAQDAREIVEEHLVKGHVVDRLVPKAPDTKEVVSSLHEMDFFRKQKRVVLRNCGVIDPMRITDYIARDGYEALAKALFQLRRDGVIDAIDRSGLRDRIGQGKPIGPMLQALREGKSPPPPVWCYTEEGDPCDFTNRSIAEGDPHSLIEGMIITAFAVRTSKGDVYYRTEGSLAIERLRHAIKEAREYGVLGQSIMGSDFNFDIDVRWGSNSSTADDTQGLKPLGERTDLFHTPETYGNVPIIILKGPDEFRSVGTEKSKGTKIFTLVGSVRNRGLVEVSMGCSVGEMIYDIGGGVFGGKKFRAAQIGGPWGGYASVEKLNMPLDFESLGEMGGGMDSGRLLVLNEDTCMVNQARVFLRLLLCGLAGSVEASWRTDAEEMIEILNRISGGSGREQDVEKLLKTGKQIQRALSDALDPRSLNPVLSTLSVFREEYDAHIRDKHCAAGVCSGLVRTPCQNACPAGVDVPGYVTLIGQKRYEEALSLHRERNPFAGVCARVCFHSCEDKCRRLAVDEPVSIRGLKRFMVEREKTPQLPEMRQNARNAIRKVAIVGAGPAGLSCAYFLARLGYHPEVFEAEAKPGGMLVQTIPAYRLPREVIEGEIEMIQKVGVNIRTGMRLGRDFTLRGLRDQGYEAVFLGMGAPQGRRLDVPGEDLKGVTDAIRFLREYNLHGSATVGEKVIVIGGGNATIDAARTAVRLGAEEVSILYRRTRDEMPAYGEEIQEAEQEGVRLQVLVAPMEILGKNGGVIGLKCCSMRLAEFDQSGRRRPVAKGNGDFVVEADQVIAAIGQRLDTSGLSDGNGFQVGEGDFIKADPVTGQTTVKWIFAGGDAVTGPASVVWAVGAGERAAVGIDEYLTGERHAFWREGRNLPFFIDPETNPLDFARVQTSRLPVTDRKGNFNEIEQPLSENQALQEAKRCLRCEYPVAIALNQQKCKGCLLCTQVCPKHLFSLSEHLNTLGYLPVQVNGEECVGCLSCATVCPDSVFEISRQRRRNA